MSTPEELAALLQEQTQTSGGSAATGSNTGGYRTQGSLRDPLIGTVLAGRYELERLIGKGGMSSVYAAQNRMLKSRVAIKLMQSHLADNPNAVMRFKQEAIAVNQLKHNNIVGIQHFDITDQDAGETAEQGTPFIVMDLLDGKSLSDVIAENGGGLPVERVLHIFEQACAALDHAHSRGIIHRDLKPSNLMLVEEDGEKDVVKIVDFGIAKMLPQEGEEFLSLTQTGEIFGSPLYMSPEQCTGQVMNARSDIYSMGCILYESLAGEPPLRGNNVFETISKHCTELPAPLASRFPKMEQVKALDSVILRAMAKDPAQRYPSMQSLLHDLHDLQRGEGKSIPAYLAQKWRGFLIKAHPGTKRLPLRFLIGTGAAVAVIAGATTFFAHLRSSDPQMPPHSWQNYEATKEIGDRWTELKIKQLMEVVRQRAARGTIEPASELRIRSKAAAWYTSAAKYNDALVEYGIIHTKLKALVAKLPLPEQGDMALNTGDCFYEAGDYPNAAKWYEAAADCWKLTTDFSGSDGVFSMSTAKLADVYMHLSQPKKGLDVLQEPRGYALEQFGPLNRALYFSKKGEMEYDLSELLKADHDYKRAIDGWLSLPQKEDLAFACYRRAQINEKLHRPAEAEALLKQSAAIYKELRKNKEYAATLMLLSRVQYERGNLLGAASSDIEGRSVWTTN